MWPNFSASRLSDLVHTDLDPIDDAAFWAWNMLPVELLSSGSNEKVPCMAGKSSDGNFKLEVKVNGPDDVESAIARGVRSVFSGVQTKFGLGWMISKRQMLVQIR